MSSELIDSIFDVAKISKEVSDITANLEGLKSTISTFSADVKKAMDSTRSAKNSDDLSKSAKQINDAMTGGSKAAKEYQTELEKLKAKTEQLTGAEKNANIEIAKARLELAAAQKEIKATAAAEIEAAAATNKVADSYSSLQKDLKDAQLAYKEMSKAERESASGKALIKKISETQNELKDLDKEMGVFNRNVGNYAGSIESMLPKIGGLGGVILNAGRAAFSAGQEASSGEGGFKALGKTIVETGKAMLKNPFVLIGAAIIGLIKGIKNAIGESEERTNAISTAFAQFKPILRTIGDGFEFLADAVIETVGFLGKAFSAVTEFLGINPKGSSDAFVSAEKSKQAAILETRKLNEQAAEQEAIIAEQREILADKENYSYSQRTEALKKAGEAEKKLSSDRQRIAELNLKALQEEAALDDNNAEINNKISAAIIAVSNAKKESADVGRKLAKEQQKLTRENQADLKAEADAAKATATAKAEAAKEAAEKKAEAAKEAAKQIQDAQRRLTDSQITLMAEGEAKQIAILNESFKRKLEDLKTNGQLTNELEKNLTAANAIELQKIRDDFAKQKSEKDKADFDKRMADFEKNIQKEVDLLSAGHREKETELKRQYAAGKIDKQKYESDLLAIQSEALKEANDLTIKNLQKELEIANMSTDKRAEISAKIRDLQIDNENAVLDATIEANQKKVDSDKEGFEKRLQIAEQLTAAGMELFQAIGDFEAQQSENRLAELEKQQAANDNYFAKRQENLDNAIMSDASREAAQKAIDEEKAKRDKAILDKKREEEIRQAKWEKAQALTSAIISTALATIKALVDPGGVLGVVFAALAAATGAAQIATILSRPIPAFEKGGITGDGLALWGEARPEVALTKTGDVMFTERPTISKFDAGTRIFKSVEDFEKNMISTGNKSFEFDYQKMAELMPRDSIELNGNGSWTAIDKENNRRSVINRRIKLN